MFLFFYILYKRIFLSIFDIIGVSLIGYDMKSGVYSTWTESVWQSLGMRMLLKPSAATERFSLILGSIIASFSFVIVWFIASRAHILFNTG
jgi:nicastrin